MKWSNKAQPRHLTRVAAALVVTATGFGIAGCSSATPPAEGATAADPTQNEEPQNGDSQAPEQCGEVVVLINDMANPWVSTLADGVVAAADELGVDVTVHNAEQNIATQISQMQQALAEQPDGIILQTVEADGIIPSVQQANTADVPVVAINAAVGEGAEVVTYIGVDQKAYGVGLAQLVEQALPDGGKVAVIQGLVGNPVEVDRTEGIMETFDQNPAIEVVATVTDSWSNADNLAVVQDLLTRFPAGELDAIVAQGPELYVGAEYAQSIGRTDVSFIAADFPVQVRDAILADQIFGTVLQDGATIGAAGLQSLCDWIAGNEDAVERPTSFQDLPLITKDNIDQFETSWNW